MGKVHAHRVEIPSEQVAVGDSGCCGLVGESQTEVECPHHLVVPRTEPVRSGSTLQM